MQLIDEAKPGRLTHLYNREWGNNFTPRRQAASKSTALVLSRRLSHRYPHMVVKVPDNWQSVKILLQHVTQWQS